ncbi:hypothetical protein PsAD46_01205 [Pseudovibrio sp. Ad46]|nr:hypothetical protein PsAD46_01205 [Pseudovibrio sp. Ad46]KZL00168.1 hypothetical protein PsAD5_01214 [Pseudovibrio sp. Ad5]
MGKVMAWNMETTGTPIVKGGAGQVAETFEKILQSAIGEVRG